MDKKDSIRIVYGENNYIIYKNNQMVYKKSVNESFNLESITEDYVLREYRLKEGNPKYTNFSSYHQDEFKD